MRTRHIPWLLAFGLAAAVVVGGGTALGGHHLADENEPKPTKTKPTKIIAISPADHVMLVGGKRTLNADICNEDGTGCKPAKKARWSLEPKDVITLSSKKGAQSVAEGIEDGTTTVTVKQGGAVGSTTVKINQPRDPDQAEAEPPDRRLFVLPQEADVAIGEEFLVTAWGCSLADGLAGENGVPDGVDDQCTPEPLTEVNVDESSGARLLGVVGPSALVRLDEFTGPADGGPQWFGVQAVTEIGGTLVDRFAQSQPFDGSLLADLDGDGDRDADDIEELLPGGADFTTAPLLGEALIDALRQLDLNTDGSVDATDAGLFALLEISDGGEPSGSWGAADSPAALDPTEESAG